MRTPALARSGRLLAPLLWIATAFAVTRGPQDQDDEGELRAWKPSATPKHELPVHGAAAVLPPADERTSLYQPVLVDLPGEGAMLAAVEYTFGVGDRLGTRAWHGDELGDWEWVTSGGQRILRPAGALDGQGRPQLLWLEIREGAPGLWTSWRTEQGWTTPAPVAGHGDRDLAGVQDVQCLTVPGGDPWLAVQAWMPSGEDDTGGRLGLFLARLAGDHLRPLVPDGDTALGPRDRLVLQESGGTDTDPTLALGPDGTLWVAWSHYTGADREVFLRALGSGGGFLTDPINLTQDAPSDDRHPTLAVAADGTVWCAFDRLVDPRRGRSVRDLEDDPPRGGEASLKVLCWKDGQRFAPQGDGDLPGILASSLLISWGGARPRLAFDPGGRPIVLYRYFDEEGGVSAVHSYPLVSQTYDGGQWTLPALFPGSEGSQSAAALVVEDARLLLAWHQDERHRQTLTSLDRNLSAEYLAALDARGQHLSGRTGPSAIGRTFLSRAVEGSPPAPLLLPVEDAPPPWRSHPLGRPWEDPVQSGRTHLTVDNGTQELRVYWGDLHRHSSVSRCLNGLEPTPEERFDMARDVCGDDFMALTDHSGHMDPLDWWHQQKLVELLPTPSFTTFLGFEWSHATYGHQNVILRRPGEIVVSPLNRQGRTPEMVWDLLQGGQALAIPHHTAHTRMSWQWSHFDPELVRLVEVFQAARGSFEAPGAFRAATSAKATGHFVRDGLGEGHRFGLIASTDHGNEAAYAAVLATGPSREELFEALLARRTYGATTKGMLVDLRVDQHWMGEEVVIGDREPELFLDARGTRELAEVQVFRNGRPWWGRGHTVRRERPDEVVFELRYWLKGPLPSLAFRIETDRGRFETVRDSQLARDQVTISARGRVVEGAGLEDESGGTIVRRFRYRGPVDARLQLEIAGTWYRDRIVRELLRTPITQAGLYQFSVKDSAKETVDLETGLGSAALTETWTDEACPDEAWYYARVIQTDGEVAWSSPVFVRRQ